MNFLENNDVVQVIPETNDLFTSSPTSTAISLKNYNHATFLISLGGGSAAARGTVTVNACSSSGGANPVAIPFRYRTKTSQTGNWGAYVQATSAGFETPAGNNQLFAIELDARELLQAASESSETNSDPWVNLTLTEAVAGAVYGGVSAILCAPRYGETIPTPSAFT